MIFTYCVGALILIAAIVVYKLNRLEGRSERNSLKSASVIAFTLVLIIIIKSCHG